MNGGRFSIASPLQNRLPASDRLLSWGLKVETTCKLCLAPTESRDHLFTDCAFSREVCRNFLELFGIHKSIGDWNSELVWCLHKLKGKSALAVILRLVWRGYLYHIWRERNNRVFVKKTENPQQIFDHICTAVRIRISKLNLACSTAYSFLLANWSVWIVTVYVV